jgi:SAM-dependent methyltransferase
LIEYHRILLADELRTNAYREAIARTVKAGDVVVDVGCGSGVLSFFACEAGAARVYAIDRGGMAGIAQFLARHLGFEDRITVLREESTAVELPERADVLITETLGVLGLDENILGSVIDARARLLRPGAAIVPQGLSLSIVPVELEEAHARYIASWSERRYGLDLAPMRLFASNSIIFLNITADAHVARPRRIAEVDLRTATSTLVHGRSQFTASRNCVVHGFKVWFTATLADGITITNMEPDVTHWAQGFLPLEYPIALKRGAEVDVDLESEDGNSWRWRGKAGREAFDQSTLFGAVPYGKQ